jgi:hypothetical protein
VSSTAPSYPPPPALREARAKHLRLTTTRFRHPKRFNGRVRGATVIDRVFARRGSNVEIAEAADVDERLVREWRSGEAQFAWGDLFGVVDARTALALLDEARLELLLTLHPHR